jgi:hypothetical protein
MTNHFDNYQARRGGLSSHCQGLGGCDPHRARAEQQEAVERSMPEKIETVKQEIQQIKNGVQQKEFDLLKQKRTALAEKIVSLDAQITRAKLLVDAWEKSPKQQAGIEGLGWGWWNRNIKGTWNAAFSCQHYEERLNESIARTRPLENQLTEQNTTLNNLRAQLSPENLAIQRNAVATQEKTIKEKQELLSSYEKRITDARNSYQASKDAERLALEREAQEASAKAAAEKAAKDKAKQTKTLIIVGAAIIGGYLVLKK